MLSNLKLKNNKMCCCGKEFGTKDIVPPIKVNNDSNFYGGRVPYYALAECKICKKQVYLLLKPICNTYEIINIAEERIRCNKCGKEFKNSNGLRSHKRTCK